MVNDHCLMADYPSASASSLPYFYCSSGKCLTQNINCCYVRSMKKQIDYLHEQLSQLKAYVILLDSELKDSRSEAHNAHAYDLSSVVHYAAPQ